MNLFEIYDKKTNINYSSLHIYVDPKLKRFYIKVFMSMNPFNQSLRFQENVLGFVNVLEEICEIIEVRNIVCSEL